MQLARQRPALLFLGPHEVARETAKFLFRMLGPRPLLFAAAFEGHDTVDADEGYQHAEQQGNHERALEKGLE